MSTFELVVEQVRAVAGADFAFVLTRRGRLVTRDAPRDMPESGRDTIVEAARPAMRIMLFSQIFRDLALISLKPQYWKEVFHLQTCLW